MHHVPPFGILGTCKEQAWGKQELCFVENWWKHKRQGINKMEQEVKQWRWKINHASKGVVVNGSGNGISWIMWTQGKKGEISISEKDQAPGAPLC
jgi:hypothetical protein